MKQWRHLTQRDAEAVDACDSGSVLFGRDDLLAIEVTGKHRARFINAVTTQRVLDQQPGQRLSNSLCTAQGALRGLWEQVIDDDRDVLWTDRVAAPGLIDALMSYRVAERIKMGLSEDLTRVDVLGAGAMETAQAVFGRDLRGLDVYATTRFEWRELPVTLWRLEANEASQSGVTIQLHRDGLASLAGEFMAQGARPGCFAALEVLRVRDGQPRLSTDLVEGSTPLELGLVDTVNLNKGCYLGHEALAMQSWRGQLRRHLCWIEPVGDDLPAVGAVLRAGARRAGWVGGGYLMPNGEALGLALIQRKPYEPGAELEVDGGGRVRVRATTVPEVWGQ